MVPFLISSFLVLLIVALAIYFWQKPTSQTEAEALLPPPGRGLFIDGTPDGQALAEAQAVSETAANAAAQRTELVERANAGDKSTLLENLGAELYEEILNLLVSGADSDPKVLSLASYVTRHQLPVNRTLAEILVNSYQRAPNRGSTATMLHVAALSDDAAVYQKAVETALRFWRDRRLAEISAEELRSILEGEFWILSSPTRNSGAGFLLKRTLASARRELEAAPND